MPIELEAAVVKTPSGFLKICEMALTIIALSVSQGTENFSFGDESRTFFCGGVLLLSIVVTPLLFYTYIRGSAKDIQKTPFELQVNLTQAILMIAAGSVVINTYCTSPGQNLTFADSGKTAGSLCIINGVIYGADTFFAYQNIK
ncbi:uncharacterized protein LOC121864946 [Homarus americanus]|uniref:MARVEL domain-containing protein n=1 Tax=Homarus americanus TaxID=6706 RepID=A0A8J5KLE7_HOMAM|nr:uncharacterized protein LOC121864946 [Homarus americanus]KAG7170019.1 hypothetical protein Hamer_G012241 [Homarus americanus]